MAGLVLVSDPPNMGSALGFAWGGPVLFPLPCWASSLLLHRTLLRFLKRALALEFFLESCS